MYAYNLTKKNLLDLLIIHEKNQVIKNSHCINVYKGKDDEMISRFNTFK